MALKDKMITNLGVLTRRVSNVICRQGEVTWKRVFQLFPSSRFVASHQLRTFNHQTAFNKRPQEEFYEDHSEDYEADQDCHMPPKGKKRQAEKYKSDYGFVEDAAPSSKRSKVEIGKKALDNDGNPYWEIGRLRRVAVSKFGGKNLINIREYFEKDGKVLPGKKGISLTMEQFDAFLSVLPQIEQHLSDAGVRKPTSGKLIAAEQEDEGGAEEEKQEEEKQEEEKQEEEKQEEEKQEEEKQEEEKQEEKEEEELKPKKKSKRGRK